MALGDAVAPISGSGFFAEINGSSGFTGTWASLTGSGGSVGAMAVMVMSCRAPDEFADDVVPPTVLLGGVDVSDATQIMVTDIPAPGDGKSVLVITSIPITGNAGIVDDSVEIEWSLIGTPLVDIIVQGFCFENVDLTAFDPVTSMFQAFSGATVPLLANNLDMVVGAGNHATGTGDSPAYACADNGSPNFTMLEGGGEGSGIFFGVGATINRQGFGYTQIAPDNLASSTMAEINGAYNFTPGLTLQLPAAVASEDDFNCECDDESGYETLGQLRRRLLIRLGFAAQADNPPPGMALLLDEFLLGAQRYLYRTFKALRTERFFRWDMTAGQRFYDLPDNDDTCSKKLDPYRVTWVGIQDQNQVWTPMIEGIPPEFYTGVAFQGLPERYEIRQCIEVFPAPYTGLTLRIKGHFGLSAFVSDDDVATIDSELVFLWALGNAKAHYGQADASNIASQANNYRRDLVKGAHLTKRYVPGTVPAPPWTRPKFLPVNP